VLSKRRWFSGGIRGWSWEALRLVLEVWGDPCVSPGRSECCNFPGFRWFSETSCFLMFFHTYLEATLFSYKTKNHIVFILIIGGDNVAISLVLAMILEIHVFRSCVFNEFLSIYQWKNHVHRWSPRARNSGNPCAKVTILGFFVCSIVRNLVKSEKIEKCQY